MSLTLKALQKLENASGVRSRDSIWRQPDKMLEYGNGSSRQRWFKIKVAVIVFLGVLGFGILGYAMATHWKGIRAAVEANDLTDSKLSGFSAISSQPELERPLKQKIDSAQQKAEGLESNDPLDRRRLHHHEPEKATHLKNISAESTEAMKGDGPRQLPEPTQSKVEVAADSQSTSSVEDNETPEKSAPVTNIAASTPGDEPPTPPRPLQSSKADHGAAAKDSKQSANRDITTSGSKKAPKDPVSLADKAGALKGKTFPDADGLDLQAISWAESPEDRMAIINGRFVREGRNIQGYRVVEIEPERVILSSNNNRYKVRFKR
jgi:cytoskeletal protein RodZ